MTGISISLPENLTNQQASSMYWWATHEYWWCWIFKYSYSLN